MIEEERVELAWPFIVLELKVTLARRGRIDGAVVTLADVEAVAVVFTGAAVETAGVICTRAAVVVVAGEVVTGVVGIASGSSSRERLTGVKNSSSLVDKPRDLVRGRRGELED